MQPFLPVTQDRDRRNFVCSFAPSSSIEHRATIADFFYGVQWVSQERPVTTRNKRSYLQDDLIGSRKYIAFSTGGTCRFDRKSGYPLLLCINCRKHSIAPSLVRTVPNAKLAAAHQSSTAVPRSVPQQQQERHRQQHQQNQ